MVLVPPSNPVVSVGTILGVPGIRDALRATAAPVVGLSPIVAGDHVRGMAAQLLTAIGVEVSAAGVAEHYGARSARRRARRLAGRHRRRRRGRAGRGGRASRCRAVPLMMTDHDATAAMAAAALALAAAVRAMSAAGATRRCSACPSTGIGEVAAGADLAALLAGARRRSRTATSSSSPARWSARPRAGCAPAKRDEALADETDRMVARRGRTAIVRTHHGLVMAAAGIDASNTDAGTRGAAPRATRTPRPAGCARRWPAATGRNVAVLVTDTAGRAWRTGQTDIAIGAAGLDVLAGLRRPHRPARQRARGHRPGGRRRARRRRRPGQAQARPPSRRRGARPGRPGAAARRARPGRRGAGPRRGAGHVRPRRPRGGAQRAARGRPARLRLRVHRRSSSSSSSPRSPSTRSRCAGRGRRALVTARLRGTERRAGRGRRAAAHRRVRAGLAHGRRTDRRRQEPLLRFRPALRRLRRTATHAAALPAPHTSRRPLQHGQAQQGPGPSRRRRADAPRPEARRAPPHDRGHLRLRRGGARDHRRSPPSR